jgi:hypothetical protein
MCACFQPAHRDDADRSSFCEVLLTPFDKAACGPALFRVIIGRACLKQIPGAVLDYVGAIVIDTGRVAPERVDRPKVPPVPDLRSGRRCRLNAADDLAAGRV